MELKHSNDLIELYGLYNSIKDSITARLDSFKNLFYNACDYEIFREMAFCIFTPQSSAKSCWQAVLNLESKGLLTDGSPSDIAKEINIVRFRNNKSRYLVEARDKFFSKPGFKLFIENYDDKKKLRDHLRAEVKGWGLKESGHFLRNIGFGQDIAILDRHILKNMLIYKIIDEIPKNLSDKHYYTLEKNLLDFCESIKIPPDHIDILFWYKQTKEIFK